MRGIAPLLRLGRGLRYREIPELIGQRLFVDSVAAIEVAVRGLVPWLSPDAAWGDSSSELALFKYGIADIELRVSPSLLDHPSTSTGLDVARRQGFLPRRGERWEELDDAIGCLAAFAEDFDPASCVLKLFLRDNIPEREHMRWLMAAARERPRSLALPVGYFPRELVVEDACVTNAGFIWFCTHFYL